MVPRNNQGDNIILSFPKRILFNFLRYFFKLLYHQFAWTYNTIAWIVSLGSWQKWILSVQAFLEGPRILEIGFGPGHLLASLHQKNIQVVGMDESRQMVKLVRKRLKRQGFLAKLVRGDVVCLPFASESFDQVVMTFPSEFIVKSASISEFQRVLVKGGLAVILPLAWITGRTPWERIMAWVNRVTGEAPQWDPTILEPLKTAGFDTQWGMIEFSNSKVVVIQMRKL
jgi:ubiquinone/menaquinone biosynthesis C-methylase UbiE